MVPQNLAHLDVNLRDGDGDLLRAAVGVHTEVGDAVGVRVPRLVVAEVDPRWEALQHLEGHCRWPRARCRLRRRQEDPRWAAA